MSIPRKNPGVDELVGTINDGITILDQKLDKILRAIERLTNIMSQK